MQSHLDLDSSGNESLSGGIHMNKLELIDRIAANTGVTKKAASVVVSEVFDEIMEQVAKGETVRILGFGTFEEKKRNERWGRNPSTGEKIIVPERYVPVFQAGKRFKNVVKDGNK